MAEVVLKVFLEVLLERLASAVVQSFVRRKDVLALVTKLKSQLPDIAAVIQDAEDRTLRQARSSSLVQSWLDDLRNLAYEIDELLDKFATDEGIRELSARSAEGSACMSKVRSFLPVCCGPSPTRHNHIKSKIDEIEVEMNSILNRKNELGLRESRSWGRYDSTNYERTSTCLLEPFVVGLEDDQTAIVKFLTSDNDNKELLVFPIIGTGGIGKTTLAQVVYNNPTVEDHFNLRGWAHVSERFDLLKTMGRLLASMVSPGGDHQGTDLNVIESKIRDLISGKRVLIVFDDYWSDNYSEWSDLIRPFANGAKGGSRIIVTSRHEKVASIVKSPPYGIGNLSENDHLSLFAYHALGVKSFDAHPQFEHIAVEIVRKCGGLPLAIKILAGALRSEYNVTKWQNILNSEIWRLPQFKKEILPALWISYFCLPPDLRGCFVYCSIFPKGYEFDPNELVLLWMAEGLAVMKQHKKSLRCQGLDFFEELLRRSFFEYSSQNNSRFVMHYLMHDLATSIGQISCLNVRQGEFIDDNDVGGMPSRKIRHLSYFAKRNEASERLNKSHNFKGLRTFLALPTVEFLQHPISSSLIKDLLQKLKSLRALSLRGYDITEVPDCIAYLKLLRYLDLSGSNIHELPESICALYNLETLILKRCGVLSLLPRGFRKLINLRCLDISDTPWLKDMPLGLGDLDKLEILPKFVVGGENEVTLTELEPLQYLQEELIISDLQNVGRVEDAGDAKLKDKELLSSLILEWDANNNLDSEMRNREKQVLELLQPHPNIIHVGIVGYGGVSFPSWIEDPSFVNIQRIRLHNCQEAEQLPSLGILPFLKEVEIKGMNSVCTVGLEFCGRNAIKPFQSLEVLKLTQMRSWEDWVFEDIGQPFPKLIELDLQDCPKLRGSFPPQLNVLVKLKVLDCPLLVIPSQVRFISSLREIHLRRHDQEMMSKTSATQCFRPDDDLPMVEPISSLVQPPYLQD